MNIERKIDYSIKQVIRLKADLQKSMTTLEALNKDLLLVKKRRSEEVKQDEKE